MMKSRVATWIKVFLSAIGVVTGSLVLGAFWSHFYWYGALIFCCVVVLWRSQSFHQMLTPKAIGFVVLGAVSYAIGHRIVNQVNPWFGREDAPILILLAVGVGTIVLMVIDAALFQISWKRIWTAMLWVYSTWYVLGFLFGNYLMNLMQPTAPLLVIPVVVWQLAYLVFTTRILQKNREV